MTEPVVSIIVVNWNTRELLRGCLASVYEHTRVLSFEVIVIDNGSEDGSQEMVREEFGEVRLIANENNHGFAAANNQGMAAARGKYVLLLNSDTVVLDAAIEKTVAFAEAHPEAAVTGCRVLNEDRTLQQTCFMYPSLLNLILSSSYLYKLFPRSRFFGRERMTWWDRNDEREVEVVTGCYMLVRREAIDQIGTMDEQFFMYAEETDWCYRFAKAGWKCLFTPVAQIVHLGGGSSRRVRPLMRMQLSGSTLLFFHKNKPRWQHGLACLLIAMFFLCRTPYWFGRGMLNAAERHEYFVTARTYWTAGLRCLTGGGSLCISKE